MYGNQQHRGNHVAQYLKEDRGRFRARPNRSMLDPQIRLVVPAGGLFCFQPPRCIPRYPILQGNSI